jgi:diguanylate cyclase (GGDEF)-like protein
MVDSLQVQGLASWWSRVERQGFDLTHDIAMRRRRGRLTGWFTLTSSAANAALPFGAVPGVPRQPLVGFVLLGQLILTTVLFRRAEKITDYQFTAVMLLVVGMATPVLMMSVTRGSLRSVEEVLLVPLLLAAVFCGTRIQAGVVVGTCILGQAVITNHRIINTADVISQSVGQLICFGLLALIVRGLRDSAHNALASAKKGEITDPLTGLPNRRGFERLGGHAWGRPAGGDRRHVALLVLDIDNFKHINDTLGHPAGDDVLRRFAQVLVEHTRSPDVVVRLGGEEFAVLTPAERGEGALIAERLRAAIERDLFPITVSIGVVEANRAPAGDPETAALWRAVALADAALYEAKRNGRNRVVALPV